MTALPAPPLVHHEQPAPWGHDLAVVPRQRTDGDAPAGRAVLYGSFSCPWTYLASQRADLIPDPARRPTWRMVDPEGPPGMRLSAPGRRHDPEAADRAASDLETVRALLLPGERLPAHPPGFAPHTGPAVVAYAEAVGAGVADEVRRILFDAYWQRGLDIGLPEVLRRVLGEALRSGSSAVRCLHDHGYAVTLTGGPVTTEAHLRARAWHESQPAAGALPDLGVAALAALPGTPPAAMMPAERGRG